MTRTENKEITVKDWFADKVANELGRNITMCYVFAILKETEKAVYAMLNVGCYQRKTIEQLNFLTTTGQISFK